MLRLFTAALLLLTLPAAAVPSSAGYSVMDLGELNINPLGKIGATAINEQGQVVGGAGQAFLWSLGKKTVLGALPKSYIEDFAYSVAYGINNSGQIVGSSGSFGPIFMSGLEFSRGFLYERGTLRQLTQQDAYFQPFAINDLGQIAGQNAYRGFFYEHGKLTPIGTLSRVPNGNRSVARALNAQGQVVGWSTVGRNAVLNVPLPCHAFLWEPKTHNLRDLGKLPGQRNSYAYAINARGQIVGFADDEQPEWQGGADVPEKTQAVVWRGSRMAKLPPLPGDTGSAAWGINNAGVIAGQSVDSKGTIRACLWRDEKPVDLNTLLPAGSGWTLTRASALNNRGWIVGSGTRDGKPHAFLLTPR